MSTKALSLSEFSTIISKNFIFEKKPHVAISFSGGSDSMALLLLMEKWIKKKKGKLTVIYFNHHLRDDSMEEAKYIKEIVNGFNLNFKVLDWTESKPKRALMHNARNQRYKKIINFCKKEQIISLMTAHHLDDCIETYLMRKQRKYCTTGLTYIPMVNSQECIQILRPFINIKKKRLIQTCIKSNIKWIDDPSNSNENFERVRIRNFLNKLPTDKINTIEQELKKNSNKNLIFERKLTKFFMENLIFHEYGKFSFSIKKFLCESESIQIEVLKKILVTCSGTIYPPRYKTLEILLNRFKNLEKFKFSIHSCIVSLKDEHIECYREYQKIVKSIPDKIILKKNEKFLWDSRFIIESGSQDVLCFTMKDEIWLKLKKKFNLDRIKKKMKFDIIKTLPVISIKGKFIIPYLSPDSELIKHLIKVTFYPKVPLTKKNFLNIN